jgi:hypothetical protein
VGEGAEGMLTIEQRVRLGAAYAGLGIRERFEWVALEMQNLNEILNTYHGDAEEVFLNDIYEEIQCEEFQRAIDKLRGNWEPPDPPGWEGGFADNH